LKFLFILHKKQCRWEIVPKINKRLFPNMAETGRKEIPSKNKKCNTVIRNFRVHVVPIVINCGSNVIYCIFGCRTLSLSTHIYT
jgi:hypothetical protein